MDRLLAWIGKLVGTLVAGPGAVVLGDPGLDPPDPAEDPRTTRARQVALLLVVVVILMMAGLPLPVGGAAVLIGLAFVFRPRWLPI